MIVLPRPARPDLVNVLTSITGGAGGLVNIPLAVGGYRPDTERLLRHHPRCIARVFALVRNYIVRGRAPRPRRAREPRPRAVPGLLRPAPEDHRIRDRCPTGRRRRMPVRLPGRLHLAHQLRIPDGRLRSAASVIGGSMSTAPRLARPARHRTTALSGLQYSLIISERCSWSPGSSSPVASPDSFAMAVLAVVCGR